eukprot:1934044-Rhodomonas_salina.1
MVAAACPRYPGLPNCRFHTALSTGKTSNAWNVGISLSRHLPAPLGGDAVRGIFNQSVDGGGTGNPAPGAKSALPVKQINEVHCCEVGMMGDDCEMWGCGMR